MSRIDGPSSLRKPVRNWFQRFRSFDVPKVCKQESTRWFKHFLEKKLRVGGLRRTPRKTKALEEGSLEILYYLNQTYQISLKELLECIEPHILACLYLPPEAIKLERKLRGKRERKKYVAALYKAAYAIDKYWTLRPLDITAKTAKGLREFARVISKSSTRAGNAPAASASHMGADLAQLLVKRLKKPTAPFPFARVGRLVKIALGDRWSAINPERALERLIGGQVKKFKKDLL